FGEADGTISGVGTTEAVGAALVAGAGGALGLVGVPDAEGCAALCCFNNSCRNPVSRLVLCGYKTDNAKGSRKKIPASQAVNFTRTFVVCAPKIFSVTPAPNAAPRPSLFGRCIKMTSSIRSATST